jgi:drug/metabolite transporter (DMT)-like permease
MLYLLLCILSSTGIFLIFKLIERWRIPALPVIGINYLLATLLGFSLHGSLPTLSQVLEKGWFLLGVLIGILFIAMFFLVALSSRKAGLSVTTVAAKMSVLFPMLFSMIIDAGDQWSVLKGLAILCTLSGVALTVYKREKERSRRGMMLIPLLLFAGMGLVDSLVKFAQHRFVNDSELALFSAILFLNAFLAAVLSLLLQPRFLPELVKLRTWGAGLILGAVNFGSIYFMVRALNHVGARGQVLDSSMVFGVNNMGIVVLSVLLGLLVFREQLSALNWSGIALSALALILFSLA